MQCTNSYFFESSRIHFKNNKICILKQLKITSISRSIPDYANFVKFTAMRLGRYYYYPHNKVAKPNM